MEECAGCGGEVLHPSDPWYGLLTKEGIDEMAGCNEDGEPLCTDCWLDEEERKWSTVNEDDGKEGP